MTGTAKIGWIGKTPKVDLKPAPPAPTVEEEREKYRQTWRDPLYRMASPAMRDHGESILTWARQHDMKTIMDFGAGKGTLDLFLKENGLKVHMLDLAENCLDRDVREALDDDLTFEEICLWDDEMAGRHADGVICIDVLEHLPLAHVPTVVNYLRLTALHGYCNAALFPHQVNGVELHLTLKSPKWWFQHFPEADHIVTEKDGMETHAVMVW